jgi:hypothetical protein
MNIIKRITMCCLGLMLFNSCDNFLDIETPRTDLIRDNVFSDNKTATAAILDIYASMEFTGFASGNGFSLLGAFSADDWVNTANPASEFQQFSENDLNPNNTLILNSWSDLYHFIYKANSILEGLAGNQGVTGAVKNQLIGEARFVRAFCHFYLVNVWGDVPLVLTTDYMENRDEVRTSQEAVYQQIVNDLLEAYALLPDSYSSLQGERIRPIKPTAAALLARVFLFMKDWVQSEYYASIVINNTSLFSLKQNLNEVFLKNSSEVIWQLHSATAPKDLTAFRIVTSPTHGKLRTELLSSFQQYDLRRDRWVSSASSAAGTFSYPSKYKGINPVTEYSTVMRLAEQYLIRAEARAMQDKLTGVGSAASDLNIIRTRAGLAATTSESRTDLLNEILGERRSELFCEWGHRWLDLKRLQQLDQLMTALKPSTWQTHDVLYPIPENQIINAPGMRSAQNPGY